MINCTEWELSYGSDSSLPTPSEEGRVRRGWRGLSCAARPAAAAAATGLFSVPFLPRTGSYRDPFGEARRRAGTGKSSHSHSHSQCKYRVHHCVTARCGVSESALEGSVNSCQHNRRARALRRESNVDHKLIMFPEYHHYINRRQTTALCTSPHLGSVV